jgi:undecaprenyl-diphosphatase
MPQHPRIVRFVDGRLSTDSWTGRPLTAALALAALTGCLFGWLLSAVVGQAGAPRLDVRWHHDLVQHRIGALNGVARVLTYLGSTPVAYLAVVLAAAGLARRRRYWEAGFGVVALAVGQLIRLGISDAVHRPRPPRADWLAPASGYAFPSGHSTTAVLAWGLTAALTWPFLRDRRRRIAVVGATITIAVIVGATRAYLGVHWPTDVLGGWTLGAVLLALAAGGVSLLRFRSRPMPDGLERPPPADLDSPARYPSSARRPKVLPHGPDDSQ